jgi:hypothetical protein
MRAMYLASLFLCITIASSGLSWLAGLNPGLRGLSWFVWAAAALGWITCLILDEPVGGYLGIDPDSYLAILIGFAVACCFGGFARLCMTLAT